MTIVLRKPVVAERSFFIKLGRAGEWETDCFRDGTLRLGYCETPEELCSAGKWDHVKDFWRRLRGDAGAGTSDGNQIRIFHESDENCIFITFANGLLYWCKPTGFVEVLPDRTRRRATVDGWHSQNINGSSLSFDRLSGELLKTQGFRGTICKVRQHSYLLRKINDIPTPQVDEAIAAERALIAATEKLIPLLNWKDFELLVDLVFSASGWRRIGALGGTQKTADLELILPSTEERALVQIKSQATDKTLSTYISKFQQFLLYDRMFFVWHTGDVSLSNSSDGVTLIDHKRLAEMCLDAGLTAWLREKVAEH